MLASTVVLGIAAGLAFGGRWERLADLKIALWPVLALALGTRIVSLFLGEVGLIPYLLSFAAIIVAGTANRSLPGMPLIIIGSALNLLVVVLNGGMPVDTTAAAAAGADIATDGLHVPMTGSTTLAALADVVPVGLMVHRVYSVGDLVLAAGGFWLPFATSRGT